MSDDTLMSFRTGGTSRWMSPELLVPEQFGIEDDRPTRQSDCYALGMVIYEVGLLCQQTLFNRRLTSDTPGVVRAIPVPRIPKQSSDCKCDPRGGPADRTGRGGAPWVQ